MWCKAPLSHHVERVKKGVKKVIGRKPLYDEWRIWSCPLVEYPSRSQLAEGHPLPSSLDTSPDLFGLYHRFLIFHNGLDLWGFWGVFWGV